MTLPRDEMLSALGLSDLAERAERGEPFGAADLARVVAGRNPLAAATLADTRRRAAGRVDVTHPWTLRVRAPSLVHGIEDATKVSHDLAGAAGVPATEMEMLGALPPDTGLGLATELVRSLRAARPDLNLRAFTAAEILRIAGADGKPPRSVIAALRDAGLSTLTWRPGCGVRAGEIDVHRAAHEEGVPTVVPLGTSHGGADGDLLARLAAIVRLASDSCDAAGAGRVMSVVVLPDHTDGASPLEGTAGTDDWMATSLARLATGNLVPRITSDWHVVGHKLGATLLSCGADDVVGAQAAAKWAPPTDDGPRPVNPDRARLWITEARRSPVLRDGLFREAAASCG